MDRLDSDHQISLQMHGFAVILDLEVICLADDILGFIKQWLRHYMPSRFFLDLTYVEVRQLTLSKEILNFLFGALIKEPAVRLINSFLHI